MLRFLFLFFVLVFVYSATEDSAALSLRQTLPPDPVVIYYPNGTTYTLAPDEVVHIAKEGDTVYTQEEGDDYIKFIVTYPNTRRDFDIEIVPLDECTFSLCDDPGE